VAQVPPVAVGVAWGGQDDEPVGGHLFSATRALIALVAPSTRRQPNATQVASAICARVGRAPASARMVDSSAVKGRPQYRTVSAV